jgi:hypothetical protein
MCITSLSGLTDDRINAYVLHMFPQVIHIYVFMPEDDLARSKHKVDSKIIPVE